MKKFKSIFTMLFILAITTTLWIVGTSAEDTYPIAIQSVERSGNEILSVKTTSNKKDGFARAIIAIYEEEVFIDAVLSNTTALIQGEVEFAFNSPVEYGDNQTVRIYIWSSESDGALKMCPLAQKYTIKNDAAIDKTYEVETMEIYTQNGGHNIYGLAYVPKNAENKIPTVIISHGYGGTSGTNASYARSLASHGIAAYCFDFRGGSTSSRSDGRTTDMTVFTEVSDLNAVIDMVKGLDFVDTNQLFLFGTSQGGLVSALTASQRTDEIQGLMLFYPALCISDDAKSRYPSIDLIPETTYFMGMNVGRAYYTAIYDYDIYENIARYTDNVLIIHGDRDSIVPLSYSEKAAEVYHSADLKILSGAGHGFYGQDAQSATDYILEYIKKQVY